MRVKEKSITYNVIMLYIINIAKVVFPLITLPYLTRVLTMDCYGAVAYVKAVMSYMQLVVNFGFMYSGVRDIAETQEDMTKIGKITGDIICAKCILSVGCFIVLLVLLINIEILKENILFTILSFVPVFLSTFLMEFLFRGIEQMQIITSRYLFMKSISVVLVLLCVKNDSDMLWIPIFDIVSSILAIVITNIKLKKLKINIIFIEAFRNGYQAIRSSFIYFASDIASTAFGAFNIIVIGIVLDNVDVAVFSVCMQLVNAVQALYSPIYNGIYPQMIKRKDLQIIKKVLKVFIPVVVIGCTFTLLTAEQILGIIAGKEYVIGAEVLRWFVPVLFLSFIVMLLGWPTLGAINRVKETTFSTVIAAVIQILCVGMMVGYGFLTLVGVAIVRSCTEAIMCAIRIRYFIQFKGEFNS